MIRRAAVASVVTAFLLSAAAPADAGSRSEITADGHHIVVEGGHSHAVSSTPGRYRIAVDGLQIAISPQAITIGGETRPLPADYRELVITVDGPTVTVTVDGHTL